MLCAPWMCVYDHIQHICKTDTFCAYGVTSTNVVAYWSQIWSAGRHQKCMGSHLRRLPHCCLLNFVHRLHQRECTKYINTLLCAPWMCAYGHVKHVSIFFTFYTWCYEYTCCCVWFDNYVLGATYAIYEIALSDNATLLLAQTWTSIQQNCMHYI